MPDMINDPDAAERYAIARYGSVAAGMPSDGLTSVIEATARAYGMDANGDFTGTYEPGLKFEIHVRPEDIR